MGRRVRASPQRFSVQFLLLTPGSPDTVFCCSCLVVSLLVTLVVAFLAAAT